MDEIVEELDADFLLRTYFSRCVDEGRRSDQERLGAESCLGKAKARCNRPFLVSNELILGDEAFVTYLREICVERDTLLELCLAIFKDTCRKDRKLRARHVLASVGYLLLRLAYSDVQVLHQGRPLYSNLAPLDAWRGLCGIIWGAVQDLRDGDTLETWKDRLDSYKKPL